MSEVLIFIISALLFIGVLLLFLASRVGGINGVKKYFDEHPKVQVGIVAFVVIGSIVALLFMSGKVSATEPELEWLPYGKVVLGIDNTFNVSPQCDPDGKISNRITSNGGIIVGLAKYGRVEYTAKYTHHSCALNEDRNTYDAIGFSVEFRLW